MSSIPQGGAGDTTGTAVAATASVFNWRALSARAKGWTVALVAALVGLSTIMSGWGAPKANAQLGAGDVVSMAMEACGKEEGDLGEGAENSAMMDCFKKILKDGKDVADFAKCMTENGGSGDAIRDEAGKDEDDAENPGDGEGEEPPAEEPSQDPEQDQGDNGSGSDPGKKWEKCLDEFLDLDDEEDEKQDSQNKPEDLSLRRISSAMTSWYVNSLVPGGTSTGSGSSSGSDSGDEETDGDDGSGEMAESTDEAAKANLSSWSPLFGGFTNSGEGGSYISTAGAVLGSPSKADLENVQWLMGPGDAANDAVFSYSSFMSKDGSSRPDAGVGDYALFGATLAGLGMDSTNPRDSFGMNDIFGYTMMGAYMASGLIDMMFDGAIKFLDVVNPFNVIKQGWDENASSGDKYTGGMNGSEKDDGDFDGIRDLISRLYGALVSIGWFITVPMFLVMVVGGMLMMRRYDTGKGLKRLIIVVLFLGMGIPMLGVTYTAALNSFIDSGANGTGATANSTKIVASTYLDYENWADNRLLLPGAVDYTIAWNKDSHSPTDESMASVRNNTLQINSYNEAYRSLSDMSGGAATGASSSDNGTTGAGAGWYGSVTGDSNGKDSASEDESGKEMFAHTVGMLNRYINGDRVSAGKFASDVMSNLSDLSGVRNKTSDDESADDGGMESTVRGWIDQIGSVEAIDSLDNDDVQKMLNKQGTVDDGVNPLLTVQANFGNIAFHLDGDNDIVFQNQSSDENIRMNGYCSNGRVLDDGDKLPAKCGMSPVAFYNYLNTSFDAQSATVFSTDQSQSGWSRNQHNSVNLVGTGINSWVYWFSAVSLLVSFVIIGAAYALMMMWNAVKRAGQLIASAMFATVGVVPAIVKTIVYTIALMVELFGTLFIWKLVQSLLMVLPGLGEKIFAGALGDVTPGQAAAGAGGVAALIGANPNTGMLIVTILVSIMVIGFVILAMKLRSSFISAVDEGLTRVINKFADTQVSGPNGSGNNALKQGLVAGAGMAATSHFLSGGGGDDAEAAGGTDGPDGGGSGGGGSGPGMSNAAYTPGGGDGGDDPDAGGPGNYSEPGADGVPLPDDGGSYGVNDDGFLTDADGNTVTDTNGNDVGVADVTNQTGSGALADQYGNPVIGEDGQALSPRDVSGVDAQGNLLGNDGSVLADKNGDPVASRNLVASGAVPSTASDESVANTVADNGLSGGSGASYDAATVAAAAGTGAALGGGAGAAGGAAAATGAGAAGSAGGANISPVSNPTGGGAAGGPTGSGAVTPQSTPQAGPAAGGNSFVPVNNPNGGGAAGTPGAPGTSGAPASAPGQTPVAPQSAPSTGGGMGGAFAAGAVNSGIRSASNGGKANWFGYVGKEGGNSGGNSGGGGGQQPRRPQSGHRGGSGGMGTVAGWQAGRQGNQSPDGQQDPRSRRRGRGGQSDQNGQGGQSGQQGDGGNGTGNNPPNGGNPGGGLRDV